MREYRAMMEHLVDGRRGRCCARARRSASMVDRELAATLELFCQGGEAILDAIAAQEYDTLKRRPWFRRRRRCGCWWARVGQDVGG